MLLSIFLVGCGSGSQSEGTKKIKNTDIKSPSGFYIAKDTLVKDVEKKFENYTIKVLADKTINKDATSKDYIAVYGTINGKDTNALLILNANYPKNTKVAVEIYENGKLIKVTDPILLNSSEVNFGSINLK
jgi:hypothetical protein